MFLLPNNSQINYEAVIEGMLDQNNDYWLDVRSGSCFKQDVYERMIDKFDYKPLIGIRFFKIPKVDDATLKQFMIGYIKGIVEFENIDFAKQLLEILERQDACKNFVSISEKKEDKGWIYGWEQWVGDGAFEEMKKWFTSLSIEIREEIDDFGCDCPICQAMVEGKTSEEELKKAFKKANFKSILKDIYSDNE